MKFIDIAGQYRAYRQEIDTAIGEVLESGQFILGDRVEKLEDTLAAFAGVNHAVGVSSGTDGLILALMALDLKPGEEIVTTPFTFAATAEAVSLLHARPVFVDIDPVTFNMDVSRLPAVLEERRHAGATMRGILPVSLYGQCPDMDEINRIARDYGLFVIEDACQSFGARYRGRLSCGLSDIGVTSFFPSKPLGAFGDGGMVFTGDGELADRMNSLRVHGQSGRYRHEEIGLNARLDAIQAAVVLAKFPHFEQELENRGEAADFYGRGIRERVPPLTPPVIMDDRTSVYAQYTIRVPNGLRDRVSEHLGRRGIPTAVHYPCPLHLQPAFRYLGRGEGSFPESEKAAAEVLSLPMHPFLAREEQETVIEALGEAWETLVAG
jgi:UDP-2-acetamido-2-deoxy-ribo-hexuluronate aminotransferase